MYEDEEEAKEAAHNRGESVPLYRLMKYLPSDPNTLYSAVGTTMGYEDQMGKTVFDKDAINVDPTGRGFYAAPSIEAAAMWGHLKYPPKDKDPFVYAVFEVVGTPHTWEYFKQHPEIVIDPAADGLIIDEMKIIGDPLVKRDPTYTEEQWESDKKRDAARMELTNVLVWTGTGVGSPVMQRIRNELSDDIARNELVDRVEWAIQDGMWEQAAKERGDRWPFLQPTDENKQKVRDALNWLRN